MRLISYTDVAEIAKAETASERSAAERMLASYCALRPRESTATQMRILKEALIRQLAHASESRKPGRD